MVVADYLQIVAIEVTAIASREVVFRLDAVDSRGLVEMFVGAETAVYRDRFSEFVGGHAVDSLSAQFVFA
ncbi:hypothetical protein, partial [Halorubrum sp. SP3]|uniref:hypothetical protein n=1 Tax=Halorubrum sp. SP3 TaxID=1537265 RepID=UPI0013050988